MKIIERDYLKELIDVIGTPDIKVITGVRRSGKSKLLNMLKNYIENNIKDANIININFNLIKFDYLRNYITLNNYIEEHFINGKNINYIILSFDKCRGLFDDLIKRIEQYTNNKIRKLHRRSFLFIFEKKRLYNFSC